MSSTRLDYDPRFIQAETIQNNRYFAYQMHQGKGMNMPNHDHHMRHSTDLESELRNMNRDNSHHVPGSRNYEIQTPIVMPSSVSFDRFMPTNTRMLARKEYEKKKKSKKTKTKTISMDSVQPLNQHSFSLNTYRA